MLSRPVSDKVKPDSSTVAKRPARLSLLCRSNSIDAEPSSRKRPRRLADLPRERRFADLPRPQQGHSWKLPEQIPHLVLYQSADYPCNHGS